ncbi:zinc-binding protein [Permianibacter sp. IMCC34836]|uniref:putative zinc-binding protein n=1 Tax=Permianibacter fluminis TaxID=2738515 RepID=UPI001555E613|nr:putative zinc-binding protein [Permianibacter fluminis]NQD37889.1 zinc-binding protein [Permianibacter fluminis]
MAVQRQQRTETTSGPTATVLPLVYSCSGCSSSAQLANDLALALDREQVAEMSCIAGVGGDVPALVKTASTGRPILAIDGCSRHCVRKCLQRHGISPEQHLVLSKLGIGKRLHQHYHADEMLLAKQQLIAMLKPATDESEATT